MALVAPLASSDHVYSHRVVVQGRLVDAGGLPVPNVTVAVRFEGDLFADACNEPQRPVTDAWGDFAFCWHKHALAHETVVHVAAGNASASRPLDTDLRRMVFLLQDEDATGGVAPPAWNETFRIEGRVWYRGAVDLDGVQVAGIALVHVPVNVTIATGDAANGTAVSTFSGGYGDYNATVTLDPALAPGAVARVRANDATLPAPLDTVWHRSVVDVRLPLAGESSIDRAFAQAAPGSSVPRADPLVVMGSVLAATISFAWVSRRR